MANRAIEEQIQILSGDSEMDIHTCMSTRRLQWLTAGVATASIFAASHVRADDWPQWLGPQRDGVWRETGILTRFPSGGPKCRWRTPVGLGYAGPAVAEGRVYVTDLLLAEGASLPADSFGRKPVAGKERVLCLDEAGGKVLWKHEYP